VPEYGLDFLDQPIRHPPERFAELQAEDPELARRVERFVATCGPAPRPSEQRVLCHADLDNEHILIDLERETVTGVIDWADIGMCPPCAELEGFAGWRGRAFTAQVLRYYRGAVTEADMGWIRQRTVHIAIGNLCYGRMAGRRPYVDAGLHSLRQVLDDAWDGG
jgi:aminoglycoside phosphotransferase (APT) family kinase protein